MAAILGQDCSLVIQPFLDSPPFLLTHPCVNLSGTPRLLSSILLQKMAAPIQMLRTSTQEFTDPTPPVLAPAMELRLFVALSPVQFAMLTDRRPILPDPYSLRFGLRSDPSCRGLHHTLSHLLASPSRSTCFALSFSLRKECSHFSLPIYWRRETAQTQTGLDTSGSVDHSSMNFVDQMPTRRSSTGSKISIQS